MGMTAIVMLKAFSAKTAMRGQAKYFPASFVNVGHFAYSICENKKGSIVGVTRGSGKSLLAVASTGSGLCQVEKIMGINLFDLKCQIGPKHFLVHSAIDRLQTQSG